MNIPLQNIINIKISDKEIKKFSNQNIAILEHIQGTKYCMIKKDKSYEILDENGNICKHSKITLLFKGFDYLYEMTVKAGVGNAKNCFILYATECDKSYGIYAGNIYITDIYAGTSFVNVCFLESVCMAGEINHQPVIYMGMLDKFLRGLTMADYVNERSKICKIVDRKGLIIKKLEENSKESRKILCYS